MIKVLCVGKIKESYLTNLIEDYCKRINKYHKLEIIELKDSNIYEEGSLLLKYIKPTDYVVTMAIEGTNLSSIALASKMEEWFLKSGTICFIIGGSNGIDSSVKNRANFALSFGNNTFPHGLFRGILLEQIYRSFKINNNETYHK